MSACRVCLISTPHVFFLCQIYVLGAYFVYYTYHHHYQLLIIIIKYNYQLSFSSSLSLSIIIIIIMITYHIIIRAIIVGETTWKWRISSGYTTATWWSELLVAWRTRQVTGLSSVNHGK
jgi:hypothetical protein